MQEGSRYPEKEVQAVRSVRVRAVQNEGDTERR